MSDLNIKALLWPKIITAIVGKLFSLAGAYAVGLNGVVFAAVVSASLHLAWLGLLNKGRMDN